MSLKSVVITMVCDVCQGELVCETTTYGNESENQMDAIMFEAGWWTRPDFEDICWKHPKPVSSR